VELATGIKAASGVPPGHRKASKSQKLKAKKARAVLKAQPLLSIYLFFGIRGRFSQQIFSTLPVHRRLQKFEKTLGGLERSDKKMPATFSGFLPTNVSVCLWFF
jgi:hypothetical protein